MEKDERLLPLPNAGDLQLSHQDVATAYSPFYDEDNFKESRSIREYFLVVYKRLPLILALTILATAATAFYMYRQPSIYEAQTTLIIMPPKPKVTSTSGTYINFGGGDLNYYNTQLRLLQNPDLMREVVIRLGLYRDPNLFSQQNKGVISSLRSMFIGDKSSQNKDSLPVLTETSENTADGNADALTPEEKQRVDVYAGYLLGGLVVDQMAATNLFNIKVQNYNPDLAAAVADTVAKVFITQDIKREMQGAEKNYEDLSASIKQLEEDIRKQEQERLHYMQSTGIPLQTEGEKVVSARLQEMSSQWLAAEGKRRDIQAQLEAAVDATNKGSILPVIVDDRAIQEALRLAGERKADLEKRIEKLDSQIQDAEEKRAQLLVKYTEEYPDVKAVNEQIKKLKESKNKVQTEVSEKIETDAVKLEKNAQKKILSGLQANLTAAQKREQQAYQLYLKESGLANDQGVAAMQLTSLSSRIENNRNLLKTYTQRQKEMELSIRSESPENIKVSSSAQKPGAPIGPNRNRNIIVAFLISLAAGIGLAFLFDYLDDSIKSSDDVGRHLGLPTLALIPHHNTIKKPKGTAIARKNGNFQSMALISLEDNRSAIAESYRHLRTSLLFSSAGKPPQTILVTSSQPSEGKTTTAINTAITLAQSGAEVVIVDCDLRRPRLHSHFDLENATGLTNYLSGDRNAENLLKPYLGLPNLKVVTSGPIPPNPAELLSSNEMKNLLQFLKGNFKHVVIDSPPAISFTDAAILSTLVDGVVLVAMAGKSSIHLMQRFKQRLAGIGARIYGVVLNGIKPNTLEYGYYGYGYTYSYYDTPEDDDTTPRMEDDVVVRTTKD